MSRENSRHTVDMAAAREQLREAAAAKAAAAVVAQVASIAFVTMAEGGQIDDVTAMEHAEVFADWAYPVDYTIGQIRRYQGVLYRCAQGHVSQGDWSPDRVAALWVRIADPAEEWPEWAAPVGAHDAYMAGDQVSHGGKHWVSEGDHNVWEPGVAGWREM